MRLAACLFSAFSLVLFGCGQAATPEDKAFSDQLAQAASQPHPERKKTKKAMPPEVAAQIGQTTGG